MPESALNILLGLLAIVNVWIVLAVRNNGATAQALREADAKQAADISNIRELVAGKYLTRDEFQSSMMGQTGVITRGFERMELKLDGKMDKAIAR